MKMNLIPAALAVILPLSATSAMAQNAFCGGFSEAATWLGGDAENSDIATSGGAFDLSGTVPSGGQLTGMFTVSEFVEVRVEAAPQNDGDTVLDLRNEQGIVLISDDDSGGFLASRAEIMLDPGTYCLSGRGFDGQAFPASLRVGRMEHIALTNGNSSSAGAGVCSADTEAALLANGPLDQMLADGVSATASANDAPYYRFVLDTPTSLSLTATNPSADPVLTLYDNDGFELASNDDFDGLNSRIDMLNPMDAGTYCIAVSALSDSNEPITVSAVEFSEQDYLEGLYSSGESSPPLDGSYPVTDLGVVETRLRKDVREGDGMIWFSFDVSEAGLMLINGVGASNNDPYLVLFDDLGRRVAENDDFGQGLDSQLAVPVSRGTYVIGVGRPGYYDNPGMTRLTMERYVPAQ